MKNITRTIVSIVLSLVVLILLIVPGLEAKPSDVVTIPDDWLESAIRDALDKPTGDILQADLKTLTQLDISWYEENWVGVTDLTGIEYCTNLVTLNIWQNMVRNNLAPLSKLTKLRNLTLQGIDTTDISPLSRLTTLQTLDLGDNYVLKDIAPLAKLTNLTSLYLGQDMFGSLSNISPLTRLTKIKSLDLSYNSIEDITALVNNRGLNSSDSLNISGNSLDLTPGSQDMLNIQTLIDRGVSVTYQ